jgi:hypothetical protein
MPDPELLAETRSSSLDVGRWVSIVRREGYCRGAHGPSLSDLAEDSSKSLLELHRGFRAALALTSSACSGCRADLQATIAHVYSGCMRCTTRCLKTCRSSATSRGPNPGLARRRGKVWRVGGRSVTTTCRVVALRLRCFRNQGAGVKPQMHSHALVSVRVMVRLTLVIAPSAATQNYPDCGSICAASSELCPADLTSRNPFSSCHGFSTTRPKGFAVSAYACAAAA